MLAMCGGVLGIMFMVPLRRFLIEREHGKLPYPEGTACAEVLVANEVGGGNARFVFIGLAAGAAFKALTSWARAIPDAVHLGCRGRARPRSAWISRPALFGVGFILGPRIAAVMVGGGPAVVAGDHPDAGLVGRRAGIAAVSRDRAADDRHDAGAAVEPLRPLHRRGRRGGGRHHHAGAQPAGHGRQLPHRLRAAAQPSVPATPPPCCAPDRTCRSRWSASACCSSSRPWRSCRSRSATWAGSHTGWSPRCAWRCSRFSSSPWRPASSGWSA
jgi:hypothetical protein